MTKNVKKILMHAIPFASSLWLTCGISAWANAENSRSKHPVVIELFTSEGCSSCPSADSYLASLPELSLKSGEIITISEHVDYWNYLGWTDPFSSDVYTERQRQYARALNQSGLYTPEMVINGKQGLVGSDSTAALYALKNLSAETTKLLQLKAYISADNRKVSVELNSPGVILTSSDQLVIFITEDKLSVQVRSGENAGRTLQHTNVARAIKVLDKLPPTTLSIPASVRNPRTLKAVVIIQNKQTMAITAAGATVVLNTGK
ncbi:MAG: hypothetical protein C0508_11675 [Cyanobacteria bacterium PR.023]|nr:hypothetical protein [Cyanobacteria bacterium PR.023]